MRFKALPGTSEHERICVQELQTAGKRKADPEKPSFKDEPLEAHKQKRPRVPVTAILPPAIAKPVSSSSTSWPQDSSAVAASGLVRAQSAHATDTPAAEPEQAPSADLSDQSAQRAAYLWPSQAPVVSSHMAILKSATPGSLPDGTAAEEQEIEVEEVEWQPGEAAGPSSGNTMEALPAQAGQQREASPPQTQVRYGTAICQEIAAVNRTALG